MGTGYSYVESLDALTTDIDEIALDLITFAKVFFTEHTDLQVGVGSHNAKAQLHYK